ncbi:hypothetical protein [Amycolatopsis sp. cmx-11-12]|uniref:hypothetical protein n=1 Tax=Amycolatopsis sp. cmx-11-12 TaxID=2785795 RepID=UPI0039170AD7
MNPLVKPPRVLGTGTLAFAGLLAATVLASGLSSGLESTLDTGVRQVAYEPPAKSAKEKLKAKILAQMLDLAAPLDPADPDYQRKLYKQVLANRAITKLGSGSVSISAGDLQGLVSDAFEIHRRSRQTVDGLRNRMSTVDKRIADLRQQVRDAKTGKARDKATAKLTRETNSRKDLNKLLKNAEHQAKPFNRDAYIRNLERTIWGLEQQTGGKQSAATKKKIEQRLAQARENLKTAIEDRDGGDEGGTPAKRGDPKQPPKNPSTGAEKTTTTPPAVKQQGKVRVPTSTSALEKAFRGAGQVRAGLGPLQGVAPPYSFKEVHDNKYLPTAYAFAQALQDAPTEKDRKSVEGSILRHVLPDPHKRKTFLEALRNTYRPQIVPDGKGNYVKAVNPIRTDWEERIARTYPVKVPTPRERAIRKQEQIDREDNQRGGPVKKPVYSRKDAIRKQEQIDRTDQKRGVTAKKHVTTPRERAIRKQEQIDRADTQRGIGKTTAAKKPAASKKPTGKGGRNIQSAV